MSFKKQLFVGFSSLLLAGVSLAAPSASNQKALGFQAQTKPVYHKVAEQDGSIYLDMNSPKTLRSHKPLPLVTSPKVNINTASVLELQKIVHIGPSKAKAIAKYRALHGPFKKPSDITKVKGIGSKLFKRIKGQVVVTQLG